jgi:hypothetical protein
MDGCGVRGDLRSQRGAPTLGCRGPLEVCAALKYFLSHAPWLVIPGQGPKATCTSLLERFCQLSSTHACCGGCWRSLNIRHLRATQRNRPEPAPPPLPTAPPRRRWRARLLPLPRQAQGRRPRHPPHSLLQAPCSIHFTHSVLGPRLLPRPTPPQSPPPPAAKGHPAARADATKGPAAPRPNAATGKGLTPLQRAARSQRRGRLGSQDAGATDLLDLPLGLVGPGGMGVT